MYDHATQIGLACLCYDRENYASYCKEMIPGCKVTEFFTDTEYFGIIDNQKGHADVFMRGTHGDTLVKKIVSWAGNLMASDNDEDGRFDGFQAIAEAMYKRMGDALKAFDSLGYVGHSRACSCLEDLALMVGCKKTWGRVFCPPVPGNADFAKRFNAAIPDWVYYRMPGDLINAKAMRNAKDPMLDGVDVGIAVDLPPVGFSWRIPILRAWQHSPRRICRSAMAAYPEEKKRIQWVLERCMN